VFHATILAVARPDIGTAPGRRTGILQGLKALIVDDTPTNLEVLRTQTESWGMIVRAISDPRRALACVEGGDSFDLIITDHHMPEMDGLALAIRIRALPQGTKTPIILFTSLGTSERATMKAGADFAAVLTKPIRQSELHDRVTEALHRAKRRTHERPSGVPVELSALSILLAEDNAVNQMVALAVLERLGYRADVAANGGDAIRALEAKPYDVILMDMRMPDMGGIEATRAIRARGSSLHQPLIIAMTANALEGDRGECLAAGMDGYLTKPIVRDDLAEALGNASKSLAS
jgi:CheY-like chemotaxis protein